jgi:hypothetical protein
VMLLPFSPPDSSSTVMFVGNPQTQSGYMREGGGSRDTCGLLMSLELILNRGSEK